MKNLQQKVPVNKKERYKIINSIDNIYTAFCFPPHLHWQVPSWWPSLRRHVLFAFVPPSELWRNFLDQSLAGAQTDPVSPDGNPFHWRSINYNCIIIIHLILAFIDPKSPKICCFHRFQNRYIMFRILYV